MITREEIWQKWADRYIDTENPIPLFETDENLNAEYKNYGNDDRQLLKRSEEMEALVREEGRKVINDWHTTDDTYNGLIYLMYWLEDDDVVPLYISNEMSIMQDRDIYQTIRNASRIVRVNVQTSGSPDELGGEFSAVFSPSSNGKDIIYTPTESDNIQIDVNELESWIEGDDNPMRNIDGNTFTEFKITVESAGSQTTIDLREDGVNRSKILDNVDMEGGHPVPSYMGREARQFVNQELLPSGADNLPGGSLLG